MSKGRGRPSIYTTDDIKMVIDQYVRHTEGRFLISASDVAKFAADFLRLPRFKYYTIQRNEEARQYLQAINERIQKLSAEANSTPTAIFKTLDIAAMLAMNKKQLGVALANINVVIENMTDKQTMLIQENSKLNKRYFEVKKESDSLREEFDVFKDGIRTEMAEKDHQLANLKEENESLRRSLHIAWDNETENILKNCGIFENDGVEINKKKVITSPSDDLRLVINPIEAKKKNMDSNSGSKTIDLRDLFLADLKDI